MQLPEGKKLGRKEKKMNSFIGGPLYCERRCTLWILLANGLRRSSGSHFAAFPQPAQQPVALRCVKIQRSVGLRRRRQIRKYLLKHGDNKASFWEEH